MQIRISTSTLSPQLQTDSLSEVIVTFSHCDSIVQCTLVRINHIVHRIFQSLELEAAYMHALTARLIHLK